MTSPLSRSDLLPLPRPRAPSEAGIQLGGRRPGLRPLRLFVLGALACALLLCAPSRSRAACTVSNFTLNFGSIDVLSAANTDVSGTGTVTCSGLLGIFTGSTLAIGCGLGLNCAGNLRTLTDGTNTLRVEFYTDSSYSQVWQGGSLAINLGSYTGSAPGINVNGGGTVNFTVYGRVPGGQSSVPPGNYTWTGASTPTLQYCILGFVLCLASATASATTPSTATATVPSQCSVVSTSPVSFPNTGLLTSAITAVGAVTVKCSASSVANFAIDLGNGQNYSGTRRMANGANFVPYALYQDNVFAVPWGSAAGGSTYSGIGTGGNQSISVYGRVAAQAVTPPAGAYSDSVVVTVTY